MRAVFRMSAIVAAASICAATTLTLGGCGQRGPLYLPVVPPMPQRPENLQDTPPSGVTPSDETASRAGRTGSNASGDVPDTSGEPLSLAPETDLKTTPAAPKAASSAD
ncbi:lipoprotein [Caballeronia sp. LZ062]|uniref:LPS translocon maturation chaperone LptM n=1 Tax=unclassified Caballeronia TaxID=2646786 RepID=UPI002862B4F6|nr:MULTISPECIES: lipoprotein [unclassified Caballeronia]MDR5855605.1 lipoprotein [Caballeronia sp. LZ050]MDR5872607.1 lipoprotein [Caballeronia sp. LZ062]